MRQAGAKVEPSAKTRQDGTNMAQDGAATSQDGAKMAQDGGKAAHEVSRPPDRPYSRTPDRPALLAPYCRVYRIQNLEFKA